MMFLAIILLTIGLISSFYAYKIYQINKKSKNDNFKIKEAIRINNNLKGKIYKTGLSLIKGENNKYTLISQSKIIDTELN